MTGLGTWCARLLSHEWIALAAGTVAALVALILVRLGVAWPLAAATGALGLVLAIGSATHLLRLSQARRRFPPPGVRVDAGGFKVHVLAEGDRRGALPIVLLGGGHSAGLVMNHVHSALCRVTRSILVDRPGTGWSDTGPFPRTTEREVDEVLIALERAGESGPFVFAGYSFGGLLAANIARRRPEQVARLVLLDATPLETLVFGPRLAAIHQMRADAFATGLSRLVGLDIDFGKRRRDRQSGDSKAARDFETVLGDALVSLRGIDASAGACFANWSILRELEGPFIASRGWETVVYDGDLGDMSVWLVAPGNSEEVRATSEVAGSTAREQARMLRFYQTTRERYLATSTNARRIHAPPGSSHQFVYEHPDFTIEILRQAVEA